MDPIYDVQLFHVLTGRAIASLPYCAIGKYRTFGCGCVALFGYKKACLAVPKTRDCDECAEAVREDFSKAFSESDV